MSKKVGLVLGSGGAKGIAHIAYINALEELDIKPDVIVGTGIGALVGALYSAGITPDEMVGILEELDYRRTKGLNNYSFKDGKYGILDGIGLEEYLELIMPIKIFDRLYTPLKIVAANYETRSQHVFETGKVVPAVRASVAVPGVFSPIEVDEEIFIDGGSVNPLPIDVIRDEVDVLIAVDASGKTATDLEISVASTANDLSQCYQIITGTLIKEKMKNTTVDVLGAPELVGVQFLDFFNYENILDALDEDIDAFKVDVCKLLKPELLTKSGKPRKTKETKEKAPEVKPSKTLDADMDDIELMEELLEETPKPKKAAKAKKVVVDEKPKAKVKAEKVQEDEFIVPEGMSKGKAKRLAKRAAKQAEAEAYLAMLEKELADEDELDEFDDFE
ncbi:MAG: patatin-like phospholipase family protein [Eubacteriales bacterium]